MSATARRTVAAGAGGGFPHCAGVALGVDRLMMAMQGSDRIGDVLAFDFSRA
jgi:lysyl-tRNA synthetase class 2